MLLNISICLLKHFSNTVKTKQHDYFAILIVRGNKINDRLKAPKPSM
jgi:hypothetical protein